MFLLDSYICICTSHLLITFLPLFCCSVIQLCPIFCDPIDCSTQVFPVLHHLLELIETHVHWVVDAVQLSCPPLSPFLSAFNLSHHLGLFQWVDFPHHVAKVLELRFSISPSNEYSGLISFRMKWFDLLAVQGTLKSFLQHHSSKASICQCSAFFIVQDHWKNHSLD